MEVSLLIRAAWKREKPVNMDFMEQKFYWAMRSICFLYEMGELSQQDASEAKESLVQAYAKQRPEWARWKRSREAYRLLLSSSNAEVRRIAREVEGLFHD